MSDETLRRLERDYTSDPCEDNYERYHTALKRFGVCSAVQAYPEVVPGPAVIGGQRVFFRVYGLNGQECPLCPGPEATFKLYFSNDPLAPAGCRATLKNAEGGNARLVDNAIEGVTIDNGRTRYSTTWNYATDGIMFGDRTTLMGHLEHG